MAKSRRQSQARSRSASEPTGPKPVKVIPVRIVPHFAVVSDEHDLSGSTFTGKTGRDALICARGNLIMRYKRDYEVEVVVENPELLDAVSWENPVHDPKHADRLL